MREAAEECSTGAGMFQIVTPRGAIRIAPDMDVRPVAYETISAASGSWNHAVAFCLPQDTCGMAGRTVVTELGPDLDACRSADEGALLFDLGLGAQQVDACVRASEPDLISALRAGAGRPLFEPGNPLLQALIAFSPNRVFICRFGRIEVFQPIPPPGGQSPDGPHTHVLPRLLAHRRTHAATNPIPDGWVPCMHLYPAHPLKCTAGRPRDFDRASHDAFQALLDRFGPPQIIDVKRQATTAMRNAVAPESFSMPAAREQRTALRVWLRQMSALEPDDPVVAKWRQAFDNARDD